MMVGFTRSLWDAYVDGVLDRAAGRFASSPIGHMESNPRKARELQEARQQGFEDASVGNVMRRNEFTRERLLRRVEINAGR